MGLHNTFQEGAGGRGGGAKGNALHITSHHFQTYPGRRYTMKKRRTKWKCQYLIFDGLNEQKYCQLEDITAKNNNNNDLYLVDILKKKEDISFITFDSFVNCFIDNFNSN